MDILASIIKFMKISNITVVVLTLVVVITMAIWITVFGGPTHATAQELTPSAETNVAQSTHQQSTQIQEATPAGKAPQSAWGLGLIAAAICTSVSAIAAGIAVAIVGSAAMGAVAEKPEIMGRSIIFVGLAEGIAIYGLIVSIMILGKLA